jgi:hypothetical protein
MEAGPEASPPSASDTRSSSPGAAQTALGVPGAAPPPATPDPSLNAAGFPGGWLSPPAWPPQVWPPRPKSTFVPGWGIYAIGVGLILVGVYASSVPNWDEGLALLFGLGAIGLALVWLITFAIAGSDSRFNWPRRTWLRWAGLPIAGFLCLALMWSTFPAQVRFALSKPALEQAVSQVQAGGMPSAGWIGLEPIDSITKDADGMVYFQVAGTPCGYAYMPTGIPTEGAYEHGAPMSRIDDHWWTWCSWQWVDYPD